MKTIFILILLLPICLKAQLFGKKKSNEKDPNIIIYNPDNNDKDLMTYLLGVLHTNDTIKLATVMEARSLNYNMATNESYGGETPGSLLQHALKECNVGTIRFILRKGATLTVPYFQEGGQ